MARKYATNGIRAIRKRAGLTMEELGAQMRPEVTLTTIAKLETGQMGLTLDYINDFARVLDTTPIEIISWSGSVVRHGCHRHSIALGALLEASSMLKEIHNAER